MILGKNIGDLKTYLGISKNLDFAIQFILSHDLLTIEPGKYAIENENISLIREDYEPRDIKKCYFEAHKKYLDIQIVLKGKEGFGYCYLNNPNLIVTDEYNDVKDVKKYNAKPEFVYEMTDGSFAIVFPEDVHMPKIKIVDNVFVNKAVFKVKL